MAYSNDVKVNVLGVPAELLTEHGAVSEPVARAMAEGAKKLTGATVAVAITGVAGSKMDGRPNTPADIKAGDKPVGTVCFAIAGPRPTKSVGKLFSGDRERIRKGSGVLRPRPRAPLFLVVTNHSRKRKRASCSGEDMANPDRSEHQRDQERSSQGG